jgi:amino acid transporter
MTALQKQAWNNLAGIGWILPMTALFIFIFTDKTEPLSANLVISALALATYCMFVGAVMNARRVFHKQKRDEKICFDERDQLITYRAILYACYAVCIILAVALLFSGTKLLSHRAVSIPYYSLPLSISCLAIIVMLVYSVAVLILCKYGDKEEKPPYKWSYHLGKIAGRILFRLHHGWSHKNGE